MSQGKSLTNKPAFADTLVVDCDVHTNGRSPKIQRAIAERLEEPWRSRTHPDIETSGNYFPSDAHGVTLPGKTHGNIHKVTDPEEDINQGLCERFGVDYPIVNRIGPLDMIPNQERIVPQMRAMNDVLLDMFLDDHDHIFGAATIAAHKPEESAEEINRLAKEDKIVGFFLHVGGQERALGDPRYHAIYEAAAENDMPIMFHGTGGPSLGWNGAGLSRGSNKYMLHHIIAHPLSQQWAMASLITEGVTEKYPDLNVVMLESGLGWVPYLISRLNREYDHRRDELPLLEKTPEEYIRDQFYFATQPMGEFRNPQHMQRIVDMVGADSIVFSSDYPHYDVDTPETINNLMSHLSSDDRDKIMHGNGLDIFDLPASP